VGPLRSATSNPKKREHLHDAGNGKAERAGRSAQGKRKTARELYGIARNPKGRDSTMAVGRSFVIGGPKPPMEVSGD
jgi:hypothetical protein